MQHLDEKIYRRKEAEMLRSLSPQDQSRYRTIVQETGRLGDEGTLSNFNSKLSGNFAADTMSLMSGVLPVSESDSRRSNRPLNLLYSNKVLQDRAR